MLFTETPFAHAEFRLAPFISITLETAGYSHREKWRKSSTGAGFRAFLLEEARGYWSLRF